MRAQVFMNWGMWVARCPRPGCVGAEHFGPHRTTRYVGGLTRDAFRCADCELTCPADWPRERAEIEKVLSRRPLAGERNWLPGETLLDLVAENVEHGMLPRASEMEAVSWPG
jgi:hypothetical protein